MAKRKSKMADGKGAKIDFFRDTWIRYLGYANEIGEAFKSHIPRFGYFASYFVASSYALGDASSKSLEMYKAKEDLSQNVRLRSCTEAFIEALIWQGLASVAIPGFTINRICFVMGILLKRFASQIPLGTQSWITTAAGLGAIPVIIHPIDRPVDLLMTEAIKLSGQFGVQHSIDHGDGWSFPGADTQLIFEHEDYS
ncbi:mitochondrial fission process protein 1-like [Dendronephthya gigantea]|uniref:mitochondrial fission process protein 1-like n=1 Tax=Dendronephthya gigantea TaxID=151771 RepID=UPI00106B37E5|nr:mitochondrial fission process protein 1-like [Dendronephthya gigantea]